MEENDKQSLMNVLVKSWRGGIINDDEFNILSDVIDEIEVS